MQASVRTPTALEREVTLAAIAGVLVVGLAALFTQTAGPAVAPGLAQGLWLVLVTPLLEELAFRGVLQSELQRRLSWAIGRISLANVLTSAVFVLAHWLQNPGPLALAVVVPSLVFGYFRDRFHTVKPSILLHVVYNAAYFAVFGVSGQWLSQSSIF